MALKDKLIWQTALALLVALASSLTTVEPASAGSNLTITPITWNIVGLDSNQVAQGPDSFVVGARVCNPTTITATNLTATFAFTETTNSAFITTTGPTSTNFGDVASGACVDAYYTVVVARNSASFGKGRSYRVSATADGMAMVATPVDREIYVEHLVSQNRNTVTSITGPASVVVGQAYSYELKGSTAPNGYEQLQAFIDFPSAIFTIVSVATTYGTGTTSDLLYADSCEWINDSTDVDYMSCAETGKTGGDVTTTYLVEVLSAGTGDLSALIYDFSGSSFHYNSDYGDDILAITATDPPPPTTTTAPPPTATAPPATTTTTTPPSTTTTTPPSTTAPPPTTTSTTAPPTTTTTAPPPATTTTAPPYLSCRP